MTIIEKTKGNDADIQVLYDLGIMKFETTILHVKDIEYSICRVAFLNLYDICKQDIKHTKFIDYKETKKLNHEEEKLFNMIKGETTLDEDGNTIECISHSLEYDL